MNKENIMKQLTEYEKLFGSLQRGQPSQQFDFPLQAPDISANKTPENTRQGKELTKKAVIELDIKTIGERLYIEDVSLALDGLKTFPTRYLKVPEISVRR